MNDTTEQREWWRDFYDTAFTELLLLWKDPAELQATIKFLTEKLAIRAGSIVFDQCCGAGILSLPLAQLGAQIIGVDLGEEFIKRAQQQAVELKLNCKFYQADAFNYILTQRCDAAFNWHTSFGYAESDQRNLEMLKSVAASLKSNGKFALDYPNMAGLLNDFKDSFTRRFNFADGETILIRESRIDLFKGMLKQEWLTIFPDNRRQLRQSSVRLYLPHLLVELLRSAGFTDIELYGSLKGEPLCLTSPRCILIATKI